MRIVLDCNVVIAAARTAGVCRSVLLLGARSHEFVLSTPILREYRSVGARPKHKSYQQTMLAITELMEQMAVLVDPDPQRSFGLSDADDEIYLSTAIAGQADILITGNRRHFPEPRYGPITILSPADFLARHGR
jgi:uncharacterized protein